MSLMGNHEVYKLTPRWLRHVVGRRLHLCIHLHLQLCLMCIPKTSYSLHRSWCGDCHADGTEAIFRCEIRRHPNAHMAHQAVHDAACNRVKAKTKLSEPPYQTRITVEARSNRAESLGSNGCCSIRRQFLKDGERKTWTVEMDSVHQQGSSIRDTTQVVIHVVRTPILLPPTTTC